MKKYDVVVVGASTTGCWFAYKMAEQGFKVLVLEKEEADNVSRSYDIFHMGKSEMERSDLDIPEKDDPIFEFSFDGSPMKSPYGKYGVVMGNETVVGCHKHDYIMMMAERAKKAGAEILYGAPFTDFIFDDKKRVIGAKYETKDGVNEAYARIVADCSGIPSVARTKLPDSSYVGNFKLTPVDMFFVVLYYINYVDKNVNPRDYDAFFMQYKSWSAPAGKDYDTILGIGASYSYDYAEEIFNTQFIKNVEFPEYEVAKIERGVTPYHRSVYSFVDDGFIVMGDAACLTKPTCGEGCTSSLVHGEIAVEVVSNLLKSDKFLTKERMWSINKRYMTAQGKDFDSMRPLLMGLISTSCDEAEYLFANEIIFSNKILGGGVDGGINIDNNDIATIVKGISKGVASKKFSPKTVARIVKGLMQSMEVGTLYDNYPANIEDFPAWQKKADALWDRIGTLADTCDPEILAKLGIEK